MKRYYLLPSVLLAGGLLTCIYNPPAPAGQADNRVSEARNVAPAADVEAIKEMAKEFAEAFNRGDAKAVAAQWTENGEYRDDAGRTLIGRAAIEKEYAAVFQQQPHVKVEVLVKSVRFPAKDLAVEQGLVRQTTSITELPSSTTYEAVHVREGGKWKIALSFEAGVGQDRLEDLDWLLGIWTTKIKEDQVTMSFAPGANRQTITATFTRTPPGKPAVSGSMRISHDPETGHIRSWSFQDDGAHAQSIWHNDGKSWILDHTGVSADGIPVAERIVLQRAGPDVITWRSIDRAVGDQSLPDSPPMRLTRTATK